MFDYVRILAMEEKTIITNPLNEKLVLDTHLLFEWKCLEKKVVGGSIQFTFSRDDTKPYHKELVELEKEYGEYKMRSLVPTFVFAAIAFILITAFFVCFVLNRANFLVFFLSLVLPALAFLFAACIFTVFRYLSYSKIMKEKPEKDKVYLEEIKALKAKYSE